LAHRRISTIAIRAIDVPIPIVIDVVIANFKRWRRYPGRVLAIQSIGTILIRAIHIPIVVIVDSVVTYFGHRLPPTGASTATGTRGTTCAGTRVIHRATTGCGKSNQTNSKHTGI
jgi:hypothetical protein